MERRNRAKLDMWKSLSDKPIVAIALAFTLVPSINSSLLFDFIFLLFK